MALNLSGLISNIGTQFKALTQLPSALSKAEESKKTAEAVKLKLDNLIKPTIQPSPKIGDISLASSFDDVSKIFNIARPQPFVTPETPIVKDVSAMRDDIKRVTEDAFNSPLVKSILPSQLTRTPQETEAIKQSFIDNPVTIPEVLKGMANLAIEWPVVKMISPAAIIRYGLTGQQLITGKSPGVAEFGFKDSRIFGPALIGSYQSIYDEFQKQGDSPYSAGWKVGLMFSFDSLMNVGAGVKLLPEARLAVNQLPESFLMKAQKVNISPEEVLGTLRGNNVTEKGNEFLKNLSPDEKKAIFNVARQYPNTAVEKVIQTPTPLGEFAGRGKVEGVIGGKKQLPGEAIVGEPQPAFGLSIQPVKKVGYDYSKGEQLLKDGGIPNPEKSINWIKNVLGDGVKDEKLIRDSVNVLANEKENPNSRRAFEIITGEKLPATQKESIVYLEKLVGLSPSKKWLIDSEIIKVVNENIGKQVMIEDLRPALMKGKITSLQNMRKGKLIGIDGKWVVYTKDGNEYSKRISNINDIIIDGKSMLVKNGGIRVAGFQEKPIKPVKKVGGVPEVPKELQPFTKETRKSVDKVLSPQEIVSSKAKMGYLTEKNNIPEMTKLEQLETELEGTKMTIKDHPAAPLTKYANKNQELPEVLGKVGGKFMRFGDDIASQYGFETSEEARTSYEQLVKLRKQRDLLEEQIKELKTPAVLEYKTKEIDVEKIFGELEPAEISEVKKIKQEIIPFKPIEVEKTIREEVAIFTKIVKERLKADIIGLGGIKDNSIPILFKENGLTWDAMLTDLKEIGDYNITEKEIKELFSAMPRKTIKQLETINPELLASDAQKAKIHILAAKKGLSERQYKRLMKIFFDKTSSKLLTKAEASKFMSIIEGVSPGFKGPTIPRTTALLPPEAIPEISGEVPIKDIGIGSHFISPRLVFKNMGDVPLKNIFEPMEEADKIYESNLSKVSEEIRAGKKKLFMGNISRRLMPKRYKVKSEKLFNYLNNEEKPILTPKEKEVADWAKALFDKYADILDKSLARQGLPPINRRKNYITNLINADIKEALRGGRINSEMFAILQDVVPKAVFDPFLLAREGKLPIEKDFWKAVSVYARVTEKKLAFDEVLPRVQAYFKFLPSEARNYATWFIKSTMGKPSELDRLFHNTIQSFFNKTLGFKKIQIPIENIDGITNIEMEISRVVVPTKILTKVVAKAKAWNYFSFIGGNLRTGIINLTQPVRAVAELPGFNLIRDFKAMAYGYYNVVAKIFSKRQWRLMREKGILTEAEKMIENEFSISGFLGELTMWNMKLSEFFNRVGTTYAGAKSFKDLLKRKGIEITMLEAEALGKELSNFINFRYGIIETPKAFANPLGQLYYQYNSFALKLAEGLVDDAKRTFKPGQIEAFIEAVKKGKGAEYLAEQGPPTRLALLKYILYTAVLITAFSGFGISIADIFWKGAVPNQVENVFRGVKELVSGNWYKAMNYFGRAATPPVVSGLAPTKLLDVYVPTGVIPTEKQISRFIKGEGVKQILGFEPIKSGLQIPSINIPSISIPSINL